jgi:hypothetical protein
MQRYTVGVAGLTVNQLSNDSGCSTHSRCTTFIHEKRSHKRYSGQPVTLRPEPVTAREKAPIFGVVHDMYEQPLIKFMNVAHIVGKKRNRLGRCNKRLADKELTAEQRNRITQRAAELTAELAK